MVLTTLLKHGKNSREQFLRQKKNSAEFYSALSHCISRIPPFTGMAYIVRLG